MCPAGRNASVSSVGQCRLTLRSSGQPPGYRVLPLTSNVRAHEHPTRPTAHWQRRSVLPLLQAVTGRVERHANGAQRSRRGHHRVQQRCLSILWHSGQGSQQESSRPAGDVTEKIMGDFWVVINRVATAPTAHILLPSEVLALARRGEKEGRVSFWLQPPDYDQPQFREAWERIGHGGNDAPTGQENAP
jgi:hypothetical protein